MVDVVLFELEAVLFDTQPLRRASLREACAAHGIDLALDADLALASPVRASVLAGIATAGVARDDVMVDLIARDAARAFSRRLSLGGVVLQPGVRQFIDRAVGQARLTVVTRAGRSDADVMLGLSGFEGAFSCVVAADDALDPTPSPTGIHLALDRLARRRPVSRAAVLALEDGADGIRAARAARVRCIAVGSVPPHIAIEADAYVASFGGHTPASLDALSLPGRERVQ
jgi:beta-phosphoglucomutase-like phosphatase (HAD superfamily)